MTVLLSQFISNEYIEKDLVILVIIIFLYSSCNSQAEIESNREGLEVSKSSVKRPIDVPESASLINLGFEDQPVYCWVFYDGTLQLEDVFHDHIAKFLFKYEDGALESKYYEYIGNRTEDSRKTLENYDIFPYPGDKTMMLISSENKISREKDTVLIYQVLEIKEFENMLKGKLYKRLPSVSLDNNGKKISDYDVRIHITMKGDSLFTVSLISEDGTRNGLLYKLSLGCEEVEAFDEKLSYLDRNNGKIYFIEKDCYLEPLL